MTSELDRQQTLGSSCQNNHLLGDHGVLEGTPADEALERHILLIAAHLIVFLICRRESEPDWSKSRGSQTSPRVGHEILNMERAQQVGLNLCWKQ